MTAEESREMSIDTVIFRHLHQKTRYFGMKLPDLFLVFKLLDGASISYECKSALALGKGMKF